MISRTIFRLLIIIVFAQTVVLSRAQIPAGYYSAAENKQAAVLKSALSSIIRKHTVLEYYSSSTHFRSTDWHPSTADYPGGYFWDMYSSVKRTVWSGMNREHSLPKSWWSSAPETTDAYSDLHNLYPSDAQANSEKSNYPLGEVSGVALYSNGVVKVGNNGFPGYAGKVFEPADEYKGDFARDYMYVVTCYEDYAQNWQSLGTLSMLVKGQYPVFKPWAVDLLLKWHHNDPVSEKEVNRNNQIYKLQGNRNPFIDHPELADFIWGKYMDQVWTADWKSPDEEYDFFVSPTYADTQLKVNVNKPSLCTFFVRSLSGICFISGHLDESAVLSTASLPNGIYLLEVYNTFASRKIAKFVVLHK